VPGTLLIVNPFASSVSEDLVERVASVLPRPVEVVRTEHPGHATEIARDAGDVDSICVFSGDGTYNEVLNGLTADVPLGLIPGGGTSVLPRALGIPRDPVRAAAALRAGRERRIGLGRANGRRFGFAAGIGLDAELVRRVDARGRRDDGRRPGDRAFVVEALRLLVERRLRFEPVLELVGIGPAAFALVANCVPYTYANRVGLRLAPDASFDGGLDVFAPVRVGPLGVLALLLWAGGRGRRHVRAHDADRIEVRCDAPLPLELDGEDVGDVIEVVFEAERDAVTVLVPG
jgi:diacylglycerol kinase family enzyme